MPPLTHIPAPETTRTTAGDKNGQWECHIEPDWLMIWE